MSHRYMHPRTPEKLFLGDDGEINEKKANVESDSLWDRTVLRNRITARTGQPEKLNTL
jgi:hypothetical protein